LLHDRRIQIHHKLRLGLTMTDLGLELLVLAGEPSQPLPQRWRDVLQIKIQIPAVLGGALPNLKQYSGIYDIFFPFRIRTVSIPDPGSSKNLSILTPKKSKKRFLSS
jgi:hypothetical protein